MKSHRSLNPKALILFLLLFLISFFGKAQENTLLWEVSGNGLIKSSYLFGTIHMLPKTAVVFPEKFKQKFVSCEQTCLELDLEHINPTEVQGLLPTQILPDQKTIKDYLTPEEYKKLTALMTDSFQIDLNSMNRLKPMFILSVMLNKMMQKYSYTAVEYVMMDENKKLNRNLIGLETFKEQFEALGNIPLDLQMEWIKDLIKGENKDCGIGELNTMYSLYQKQDIAGIYNLSRKENGESMVEFNEMIINKRNANWISRIGKIASEKSTFFAFGAGHLYGEKGVISLLRKAGYTVTPIFQ
ncbi:MAG: TraB/GumN family protein [Bacteroidota bacterium]|nr:TraB/GumN family protein [Bacteroidota bacterium]